MSPAAVQAESTSLPLSTISVSNSNECVSKKTYQPITDQQQLFELAVQQTAPLRLNRSNQSPSLTATQLLEVRTYADGSVEKDYSSTTFLMKDLGPTVDVPSYKEITHGGYGVMVTCRANYTNRMPNLASSHLVRLNSVSATVQNTGSVIAADSVHLSYTLNKKTNSRNYSCSQTFNSQNFTLSCPDRSFYFVNGQYFGDGNLIYEVEVFTKDGHSIYGGQQVTQDDLW